MSAPSFEPARIGLMLTELHLPTIGRLWPQFAERSDKEGWPAGRYLGGLLEHELAERVRLAARALPRAVPDMNPHGCRHSAIDDYVPCLCNRVSAFAAPGCGHTYCRVFANQIERMFYTLSDKLSGARIFVSDVSKSINVGLERSRRPLKPPGGACGHR